MSSTPLIGVTEFYREGTGTQLPPGLNATLAASAPALTEGQLATFDSNGNVAGNDGTVANQVAAGVLDEKTSETNATAGVARAHFWEGMGFKSGGTSSDGFTVADKPGVPAFIKNENTIGKLSNASGVKRSLAGIAFGVESGDGQSLVKLWGGRVGHLLARALCFLNAAPLAWYTITDAAASTATTERAIPSTPVIGKVTSVDFVGAAVTADSSDYATITIKKYGAADAYTTGATVATYSTAIGSNGAITALTPASFTLGAGVTVLETDIFTITVTKANSGKQLIGAIRINGKVI